MREWPVVPMAAETYVDSAIRASSVMKRANVRRAVIRIARMKMALSDNVDPMAAIAFVVFAMRTFYAVNRVYVSSIAYPNARARTAVLTNVAGSVAYAWKTLSARTMGFVTRNVCLIVPIRTAAAMAVPGPVAIVASGKIVWRGNVNR